MKNAIQKNQKLCVLNILLNNLTKPDSVLHFSTKNGPKTVPRRPQDGPKMDPVSEAVFGSIFDIILGPFWDHFSDIFGVGFGCDFACYTLRIFKTVWQKGCTRNPVRSLPEPNLERLGPPPRRQNPENFR